MYEELEIPDFLRRKKGEKRPDAPVRVPVVPQPEPIDDEAGRLREIAETEKKIASLKASVRRVEAGPVPENPHIKFKQDRTLDLQEQIIRSLTAKLQRLKGGDNAS